MHAGLYCFQFISASLACTLTLLLPQLFLLLLVSLLMKVTLIIIDSQNKWPQSKQPVITRKMASRTLGPVKTDCEIPPPQMLDVIFNGRPIQRFWFLETVARMPYFSYISMLHLYETLGW
jgi:hypothetical protein